MERKFYQFKSREPSGKRNTAKQALGFRTWALGKIGLPASDKILKPVARCP
jgi:hypothetical protein